MCQSYIESATALSDIHVQCNKNSPSNTCDHFYRELRKITCVGDERRPLPSSLVSMTPYPFTTRIGIFIYNICLWFLNCTLVIDSSFTVGLLVEFID